MSFITLISLPFILLQKNIWCNNARYQFKARRKNHVYCQRNWFQPQVIFYVSYNANLSEIIFMLIWCMTQHRFQNITCRVGQAAPKVYLPCRQFQLPANLLNKDGLHCEDSAQNSTSRTGKLGSYSAFTIAIFFAEFHLQLAKGQVVMLHTVIITPKSQYAPDFNC